MFGIRQRSRNSEAAAEAPTVPESEAIQVSDWVDRAKLQIEYRSPGILKPANRNARTHTKKQITQIAASIRHFGFNNPVLVDAEGEIVAGHGRVEAAKLIGMPQVPTIRLDHLKPAERRAYLITDNRLAELAGWDDETLAIELGELAALEIDFDLAITGFETVDVDRIVGGNKTKTEQDALPEDLEPRTNVVSQVGDLWCLGEHRLLCGNARDPVSYARLLDGKQAQLVFTDPPYNVPISGHVSGLGKVQHREFAMASGEMSSAEFTEFLTKVLGNLAAASVDGSIHYVCMDWRHIREVLSAGNVAYTELKNLCVWNKDNGGMGAFYRSKHELVFVFKNGKAAHINNFGLGEKGRYRTNVWDYAGANTLRPDRMYELAMHPTVKPVAMVADAIKDCSKRGGIVLDAFGGSGTTLVAAERTGRRGYLLELDPAYVDVTIRRWQAWTGKKAVHQEQTLSFDDLEVARAGSRAEGA